ncbi:MAG: hypothetical protein HY684_04360 [Chloroflexi bacterium]|nr:hypothetical protein [Chloroflexota bacterium]
MWHRMGVWKLAASGALMVALVASTVACTAGVSQAEYDAVKQQLSAEQKKTADMQQQLTAAAQQSSTRAQEVKNLQEQVGKLQQQAEAAKGVILAAISATPAPRPTPTPGPSPTPRPVPAARITPIAFYVDTTTGNPSEYNIGATASCIRTGNFKRGMRVVFRMEIVDTSTGKVLQGADVEQASVKLPGGKEAKFSYGPHGRNEPIVWLWATGWTIPMDYPLGVVNYTVEVVTKDGKKGVFKELAPGGTSGALTVVQ